MFRCKENSSISCGDIRYTQETDFPFRETALSFINDARNSLSCFSCDGGARKESSRVS